MCASPRPRAHQQDEGPDTRQRAAEDQKTSKYASDKRLAIARLSRAPASSCASGIARVLEEERLPAGDQVVDGGLSVEVLVQPGV